MTTVLVDCYLDPSGGAANFLPYLPDDTVVWHVSQGSSLSSGIDQRDISAVVITGSAASVYDGDDWIQRLSLFLRDMATRDIPCFGICFGHQILAKILGCDVGPMVKPEVGWKTVSTETPNSLLQGITRDFDVFLSHKDAVLEVNDQVNILASTMDCHVQAFQHVEKPIWGIQFHPEMPVSECLSLLEYRRNLHPELLIDVERESLEVRSNRALADRLFRNFYASIGQR